MEIQEIENLDQPEEDSKPEPPSAPLSKKAQAKHDKK